MKGFLKFAAVVLLILGVLAAMWLGIIDPRRVKAKANNALYGAKNAGASLLSGGPRGPANSPQCAAQCRDNLRRIESAKRAIHSKGQFATGDFSWSAIDRQLGGHPVCPCGGTYSIGSTQMLPLCSMATGGTLEPADDHVLKIF